MKKYQSMNVQIKAAFWYSVCNIFQKGISFIVVPIYVRLLTTAEYGDYAAFQSWLGIISIFATFNLSAGIYTKSIVDYADQRDVYTASMQGLGTTISVVVFLLCLVCCKPLRILTRIDCILLIPMFLYFIVSPSIMFWSARQRVEYRYIKMVAVTSLLSILTPLVSISLLYYTNLRELALIIGNFLIHCLIGGFFYVYYFIRGKSIYFWMMINFYNILKFIKINTIKSFNIWNIKCY